MKNHLLHETSPYLIQHAENPVDWYPWGKEAFEKAEREDKPVFLSIGYSTCHWCHVMAGESFMDKKIAGLLNKYFVCIKVDREERPDIDSVYMAFCQAFTGQGGWPASIFMTPDQKPFYAGTYYPKNSYKGMIGFEELITAIAQQWKRDKSSLTASAELVAQRLRYYGDRVEKSNGEGAEIDAELLDMALETFLRTFDRQNGGFGSAPKFPMGHNLLFLLQCGEQQAEHAAAVTLRQMYRGGIFDHIEGGFSRYSTDDFFLVPHFEKMLYDNALLIMAYAAAYKKTGDSFYLDVAEQTAGYILREMTGEQGGFYCAQDADSGGVEGAFYTFSPTEIQDVLGESEGKEFCAIYDICDPGNFEGRSIPNLLKSDILQPDFKSARASLYAYRQNRMSLHLDDKILTSWNALMIAGLAMLYRATGNAQYLKAAKNAWRFIETYLQEDGQLYVSWRDGRKSTMGFLEDYAFVIFALLELYEATFDEYCLQTAVDLCRRTILEFYDEQGGFWLYGRGAEALVLRPKETHDGALPSGNSVMAHNLVRLGYLIGSEFEEVCRKQLTFLCGQAWESPAYFSFFMLALSLYTNPPDFIKIVSDGTENPEELACQLPYFSVSVYYSRPTTEYPLLNGKTTYYVCRGKTCLPPSNRL